MLSIHLFIGANQNPTMTSNLADPGTTKCCPACKKVKPVADFRQRTRENGKTQHRPYCRPCDSAKFIIWRRGYISRNGAKVALKNKIGHLRKKYGISLEERDLMSAKQNGKCAICLAEKPNLHVDHSHETGVVRGLLCFTCNSALGKFKDSPTLLRAAADYIELHSANNTQGI